MGFVFRNMLVLCATFGFWVAVFVGFVIFFLFGFWCVFL